MLALLENIIFYFRLGGDIRNQKRWHLLLVVVSFYAVHVLSVVLAVQSSMNGLRQDERLCHTELQWKHWFQAKDERIRSIQDQLHCCGFNSMVDRAWPFPARGVNADECQRTSGCRCARTEGYVRENGVEKKIEGFLKVGFGRQLLISHLEQKNLTMYEKVAASTFGKGFGKAYSGRRDAKTITMGMPEKLKNKKFEEMVIAGVASDRRDPRKEPVD